jgi:hypothetical protein
MITAPDDLKLPPNLSPAKKLVIPRGPKRKKGMPI